MARSLLKIMLLAHNTTFQNHQLEHNLSTISSATVVDTTRVLKPRADRPSRSCAGTEQLGQYKLCPTASPEVPAPTTAASCSCRCSCHQKWQRQSVQKCARATNPWWWNPGSIREPGRAWSSRWPRCCGSFGRTSVGVCF